MIEVPSSTEIETLADWAEASCLFGNREYIPGHKLEDMIADAGITSPETVVSDIRLEISARHCTTDEGHPVNTIKGGIGRVHSWDENLAYSFQLLLSLQHFYKSTRISQRHWPNTGKLFERLSTAVLERYICGRAINIGFPREDGVPRRFGDCLNYLSENIGESRRTLKLYTSTIKDDGADIVAWNPFRDQRPGQIIILAHCAAGTNWRGKTTELSLKLWKTHIDWVVDPLKAFTFPYVCRDSTLWRRLSHETEGIVLDRLRIAHIFMVDAGSLNTLNTQLNGWCKERLESLPWLS